MDIRWYIKFIQERLADELGTQRSADIANAFEWVTTHRGYELWQLCRQFLASPSRARNLYISEQHYALIWRAMIARLER